MFRRRLTQAFLASVLLASAAQARADEGTVQQDQLTLPAKRLVLNGFLEANLSKNAAFKPISISPDLWYGATDDVTVGLVHSQVGATGFLGATGDSLCLSGKSNGCSRFYPSVGADVRIRLATPFILDAGLFVRNTSDPFQLALKIGVGGRWRFDRFTLEALPNLFIGLNKRSAGMGNKDWLSIPLTAAYEVADKLELALQVGVQLQLEQTGDNYSLPLALAARYQVTREFGLGLAFALPRLVAPSATAHGFDVRTLMLGGSYAF